MIPKNKTGGIVTSTVMGVGGLIIGVIVILVVVQTLNNANLIVDDRIDSFTIINESIEINLISGVGAISISNIYFTSWNATLIMNITTGPAGSPTNETLIEGIDYQIFASNGTFGNLTGDWNKTNVTYTWIRNTDTTKAAVANLTSNFTSGIGEIALKIPTILLIVAVVFLLGALALLVRSARQTGSTGEGGSL